MNIEVRIDNPLYELVVSRMRKMLFELYADHYDYEDGHLNCYDWQPREYNEQADMVCNSVLEDKSDVDDLDEKISRQDLGMVKCYKYFRMLA